MGFSSKDIAAAIGRLAAAMPELEQELNRADARLGDGDTGTMLARVIAAMAAADAPDADVGAGLSAYARATAMATGSSLGTLIATGLLAAARLTRGEEEVDWARLPELFEAARDAMLARGGASLGDKTVLDGLDAVARGLEGTTDGAGVAEAASRHADAALEAFRDKPNKIGRARMFADDSKGLDDPGMLALAKIIRVVGG